MPKKSKNNSVKTSAIKKTGNKSFRGRWRREKPQTPPEKLTGSFRLFADSLSVIRQYWKLFVGITLIYLILSMLLVGGLGSLDVSELKKTFTEDLGQLSASVAVFGLLIGSTGSAGSESGAAYQTIVVILVSLATIWSLRQIYAGEKIGIRDAFYKGMFPLVPFVLVLLFLCLTLIPATIGSFIFTAVFGGELAVTLVETLIWSIVVFLLMVASLYLLSTYIFAAYVVTLTDVRPVEAIKTARKLARFRRWSILRKLLFLPVAYVAIGIIVILPLIVFVPVVVQIVFVLLSMLALVFAHTYVYSLYKELL